MNSQENPTANTPDGQASSQAEPTPAVKREHAPKATPQKTENDTSATPPPLPQATSAPQASPQDTVPPKEQHGASQDGDSPGKDEHQRPPETKTTPDKTHQPKEDNGPGNKPKGS